MILKSDLLELGLSVPYKKVLGIQRYWGQQDILALWVIEYSVILREYVQSIFILRMHGIDPFPAVEYSFISYVWHYKEA